MALNVGLENLSLPDDKRFLIQSASRRIKEIADDLLIKNKANRLREINLCEVLVGLFDEKKAQYSKYQELKFSLDIPTDAKNYLVKIDANDLTRLLSNLVTNSVEASDYKGEVVIRIKDLNGFVEIEIEDSGKGMTQEVLSKLGQDYFSSGKEGIESGFGIGIYQAFKTLRNWGGDLQFQSELFKGTVAKATLPISGRLSN